MSDIPKCTWIGASGKQYSYSIFALLTALSANQQGNYIYAKKNSEGRWVPIYIGEGDLAERSGNSHHRATCIRQKGATHFQCHLNATEANRRTEEKDLLANYTNALTPSGCNQSPTG